MVATEPKVEEVRVDEFSGAEYDEHLYQHHGVLRGIDGLEAFGDEHVEQYRELGFVSIEKLLSPDEVQSSLAGLLDVIDGKYPGFRHIQFEAKARPLLATLSAAQKQDLVRKIFNFIEYEPRLKAIAEHPRILEVVRRLIGEEPALFENKALIKPPRIGREKPWHQDHAYWNLPLEAKVVTAWIALDPATTENGCLYVIPGSHREGPVVHFRRRDWQICDTDVSTNRIFAAPLAPGGCLFFDSMLHHGTPANASPQRRRALQFVYIPASVARISQAERLAVFGSEGKDVTC
ncbi:MAG: phytanoyl-CoA dioxygenase family protein [Chloroflexi bacterium]|nr:phytanoyl-CoA dioxygenase family protein [Chloroflexota bacterium]